MIKQPTPFKGLRIGMPIIIPIKGRVYLSGFELCYRNHYTDSQVLNY